MAQGEALVEAREVQVVVRNPWGQWVVQMGDRQIRQTGGDARDGWFLCGVQLGAHARWCGIGSGMVTKLEWLGWPAMWVSSGNGYSRCC